MTVEPGQPLQSTTGKGAAARASSGSGAAVHDNAAMAAAKAAPAAIMTPLAPGDLPRRRRYLNIFLFGVGWCLNVSQLFIQVANTSLMAAALPGGSAAAQTVPVALFIIGAAASVLPAALLMRRFGRARVVFGAIALGLASAGVELLALYRGGFALLTVGAAAQGPAFAIGNAYRFMAAEFAAPASKPRAVSLVVLCGVPAAAVGPEFARLALLALPPAGGFVVLIGLYVALLGAMACVDWRTLARLEAHVGGGGSGGGGKAAQPSNSAGITTAQDQQRQQEQQPRPLMTLRELLWTEAFVAPALIAGASFCGMAALMAVTPVRMVAADGARAAAAATFVVEAHIVAMYLPGLLSADLIRAAGAPAAAAAGCAAMLAGNAAYYAGDHAAVYFAAMIVIGLGWHFAYVAASSAVIAVFAREPRRRLIVQGATDTVVISLSGTAIGTSSALSARFGWVPFVTIYMVVHGALLLLSLEYWRYSRAAAAAAKKSGAEAAAAEAAAAEAADAHDAAERAK